MCLSVHRGWFFEVRSWGKFWSLNRSKESNTFFLSFFWVVSPYLGKSSNLTIILSNGLVQPPTSSCWRSFSWSSERFVWLNALAKGQRLVSCWRRWRNVTASELRFFSSGIEAWLELHITHCFLQLHGQPWNEPCTCRLFFKKKNGNKIQFFSPSFPYKPENARLQPKQSPNKHAFRNILWTKPPCFGAPVFNLYRSNSWGWKSTSLLIQI